jgi:hypothetical protein
MKSKMQEYLEIRRQVFVMDGAREHGNNLFIEHVVNDRHKTTTTLGAMKIMALDEIVEANVIDELRAAVEQLLRDPTSGDAFRQGMKAMERTERYATHKP